MAALQTSSLNLARERCAPGHATLAWTFRKIMIYVQVTSSSSSSSAAAAAAAATAALS